MLTSLNDNITSTISKLTSSAPNPNYNLAAVNTNCHNNLDDLAISFRTYESKESNEDTDICPICNKISLLDTIECSECSLWIHNECAGLSQSAVNALNSLDFICAMCTDNMLYEVDTDCCNNSQNLHPERSSFVANDTPPDTYVRPLTPHSSQPEDVPNSAMDATDETTLVKGIYNQHDTSVLANNAKDNHYQQNTDSSLSDNIPKKPKRQNIRTMKPKINNAEDKAYILKLENEGNKLKSTLEMQSNLRQQNKQTEAASCNINSSQQSSTSNHLNSNLHSNDTIEQRFRMLEMQMLQNLSMNNMLANQHMQFMMLQQQYVHQPSFQQSSLQPNPNLGFSMYSHMSISRHIPPPPGYLQNITTNVPIEINQHPLHYQQPIIRQNAYQQHIHHSAN
ncbi:Hypothetical predicted protein [Mytilus galloprovincialis]|uniref:PHD-type domain-containing protein n=1 Tax=Mytilus galloprovincialis TaxID=29158 RepID=A0A8B6CSS8_MYTGA|nr:Hypothetical predicted protein [Mytilus galloprovincialis]